MHVLRWNWHLRNQRLVGHRVVAIWMIRRNATFVTEEEINLGPLDPMLESLSRKQFIDSPGRIAPRQSNAERIRLAVKRVLVVDKPFSSGHRQLFGSVKNENIGRNLHNRMANRYSDF